MGQFSIWFLSAVPWNISKPSSTVWYEQVTRLQSAADTQTSMTEFIKPDCEVLLTIGRSAEMLVLQAKIL